MASSRRFLVIGNPISHSKSPSIHRDFAAQLGLDIQYEKLLAPLDAFEPTVRAVRAAGVCGANVTVPFKHDAFVLANACSDSARFAQAANTLVFNAQGIYADNTDGGGLCRDLNRLLAALGLSLRDCCVLMVGAGGAASGCVAAFNQHGVKHLTILNRTVVNAEVLAQRAQAHGLPCSAGGLDALPVGPCQGPLVIVNASASSLNGVVPNLNAAWYAEAVLAYDMMYAAHDTPFVAHVKTFNQPNMRISDGLGMLVFQAELAFELWTGKKPDGLKTLQHMRNQLLTQKP